MARPILPKALDRYARSYTACVVCGATGDLVVAHVEDQGATLERLRAELPAMLTDDQRGRFSGAVFPAAFHHPRNVTRLCLQHEKEYTVGAIGRDELRAAQATAAEAGGPMPFLRFLYDEARADHHCRDLMAQMYCVLKVNEFWRNGRRASPGHFLIMPRAREMGAIHQHFNVEQGHGGGTGCAACAHCCENERGIPRWVPMRSTA